MMWGTACFDADAHITCPLTQRPKGGLATKSGCASGRGVRRGKAMSSQGEARAHALGHLGLSTTPVCACKKAEFSSAKTLGHHLREFHNVSLKELRDKDNPMNILENPKCSIKPGEL